METKTNHLLPSKIGQLVNDAKTELRRLGIETAGKRSDEILKMARQERNKPASREPQGRWPKLEMRGISALSREPDD
jgi:hypothetical protein